MIEIEMMVGASSEWTIHDADESLLEAAEVEEIPIGRTPLATSSGYVDEVYRSVFS
jgi:hypothetical protein